MWLTPGHLAPPLGKMHARKIQFSPVADSALSSEGHQIIFVERCEFLRTLHSHIRDKSRLHACTELSSYVESESGVTVKTTEGKTFEGSILIGADGVHSKTRNLVAEKLQSENKKLCKALQECRFQPPTSVLPTHYLLFGISLR